MQNRKVKLCAFGARYTHSNLALHCLDSAVPFDVQLIEANINQNTARIVEQIVQGSPDAVGFSCYVWSITDVLKAACDVKKILPECFVFLGGPEVSFGCEPLMAQHRFVDMIIRGGGEAPFSHFMQRFNAGKSIMDTPSACIRNGDEIISTSDAPPFDMNDLPFVYDDLSAFENKMIYYETSRGCPYRCAYCMSADSPVSFLNVERVGQEFEFFIKSNVRRVKLTDRTFNYPEKRALKILQVLIKLSNKYPDSRTNFHFEISAHLLSDEVIALTRTARNGLIQFEIGIQSTNLQTLKAINRNFDMAKTMRNTKVLCEMCNIHVHVDLIAGLPYEDYASFARSFNDVFVLGAQQIQLGFLKVLKGSAMFDMAKEYDIAYSDYPPFEVLSTHVLSYDEISHLHRIANLVDILHNSGNFAKTITHMCNSAARLTVGKNSQMCSAKAAVHVEGDRGFESDFVADVSGPFAFFDRFAAFAQSKGYFDRPQGKHALFALLAAFGGGGKVLNEALVYDWLLLEKPKRWPKGLKPNVPKSESLRKFYNNYNNPKQYQNLTAGEKSRRSFVCTFLYLFDSETTLLFDYSEPAKTAVYMVTI